MLYKLNQFFSVNQVRDKILQVTQLKTDLQVHLRGRGPVASKPGSVRGTIYAFTRESIKRLKLTLRNSQSEWVAMITLTYPGQFESDGQKVKGNLNAFLQFLRRKKVRYLWVLEFQTRGAPHFHILVDGYAGKEEIAERWYNIVGSGDTRHLSAGTRVEGLSGQKEKLFNYLFSYLKKAPQKAVPGFYESVGRFWGASRNMVKAVSEIFVRCSGMEAKRTLRVVRKYYQKKMKEWGYSWAWDKQAGFTGWGCASVWDRLLSSGLIQFTGGRL